MSLSRSCGPDTLLGNLNKIGSVFIMYQCVTLTQPLLTAWKQNTSRFIKTICFRIFYLLWRVFFSRFSARNRSLFWRRKQENPHQKKKIAITATTSAKVKRVTPPFWLFCSALQTLRKTSKCNVLCKISIGNTWHKATKEKIKYISLMWP